jgi:hypothetical protein
MTPKSDLINMPDQMLINLAIHLYKNINVYQNFGINDLNDLRNIEEELRIRGYKEVDTIDFIKDEEDE